MEWNGTAGKAPSGTVADLFKGTVTRTPRSVALVTGRGPLTFAELDERANRLAHLLIAAGAAPSATWPCSCRVPRTGSSPSSRCSSPARRTYRSTPPSLPRVRHTSCARRPLRRRHHPCRGGRL
ncbi:hypothetical protein NKH18_39860 [Streptomyces sp. M10(2022)]